MEGSSSYTILQLSLFFIGALFNPVMSGCNPPTTTQMNYEVLPDGQVLWWCLLAGHTFPDGVRAHISTCGDTGQVDDSMICADTNGGAAIVECPADPVTLPEHAELQVISNLPAYIKYYRCGSGKAWMSGAHGRIQQCIDQEWTTIKDICDEACDVVRDCSMIADLGLTDDGEYKVTPSGDLLKYGTNVHCYLSSANDGGGWTTILKYTNQGTPYNGPLSSNPNDDDYFIGISRLAALSWNMDGSERPLVFAFRLVNHLNDEYWSTYDDVLIKKDYPYTLERVGSRQDTIGNAFSNNQGNDFYEPNEGFWWKTDNNNGAEIRPNHLVWKTMRSQEENLTSIEVYIRPKEFDRRTTCPPQIVHYFWTHEYTYINMTAHRIEGTTFEYKCIGEYRMEGDTSGPLSERTTQGIVTCSRPTPSAPLAWSKIPILPCKIECPDDYTLNSYSSSCLRFSETQAKGISSSSLQCSRDRNASLAKINTNEDFALPPESRWFYTAHVRLWGHDDPKPGFPRDSTCKSGNDCQMTESNECLVMQRKDDQIETKATNCRSDTYYVCQVPARCPSDFDGYKGLCYKVIQLDTSDRKIEKAFEKCRYYGSSLAYPESMDVLEFFRNLTQDMTRPLSAFIGINNANGDWSNTFEYLLNSEILQLVSSTTDQRIYRYLTVPSGANDPMTINPIDGEKDDEIQYAVCQLHGPQACHDEPPPAKANMYRDWGGGTKFSNDAKYLCYPGYFMNNNINMTSQKLDCFGQLGEWVYDGRKSEVFDCLPMPVCSIETIPCATNPFTDIIPSENVMTLNSTFTYVCPDNMSMADGNKNMTSNCTYDGTNYAFQSIAPDCNVCIGNPNIGNATSTWVSTADYAINDSVIITCEDGFLFNDTNGMNKSIQITCQNWGWHENPDQLECLPACTEPLPVAGANMSVPENPAKEIGSVIDYPCDNGLYIPATFPDTKNYTQIECKENKLWEISDLNITDLYCAQMCLEEPASPPPPANMTWDQKTSVVGTKFNMTCPENFFFPNQESVLEAKCDDGKWTNFSADELTCRRLTMNPPEAPNGTVSSVLPAAPYWEDTVLNYSCSDTQMSLQNSNTTSITFNGTAWVPENPEFACFNICTSNPPEPPNLATKNDSQGSAIGAVVSYICEGYFTDGSYSINVTCENPGNWSLTTIPDCQEQTTPGPSTEPPYILPTLPPYDPSYPATSDYYWGTLQNNMSGDSLDTDGPFGFGQAVKPDPCIFQEDFQIGDENCTKNPKHCSSGFSVSVWERAIVSTAEFAEDLTFTVEDQKYILSTGGDEDGHPGFAIYHKGYWLGAVVSTGDEYWKVEVAGVSHNNTWSNVALRWEKPTTANPKGLELFVNLEKVGQAVYGVPSSALDPLDPSMMMVGCHKAQGDEEFSGFNDAAFDELAMWKRFMPDNETSFFLGGFEANFSEVSIAQAKEIFARVDMSDPAQQGAAVKILETMTMPDPEPTNPSASPTSSSSGSSSSSSSDSAAQSTASSPTAAAATMEPPNEEEAQKHGDLAEMVMSVIDPETVPKNIRQHEYESMVKAIDLVSNMVSRPSFNKWSNMQIDPEEEGSTKIIDNTEKWLMGMSKAVKFTNGSDLHHTKVADNLIAETTKMSAEEFKDRTDFYEFPNYRALPSVRRNWNLPYDRIAIPTDLFDDERCANRPVNIIATLYDTYGDIAQKTVNPDTLDDYLEYNIDARVISLNVECNPQLDFRRQVDPRAPPCDPSPSKLKKTPVRFKLEHKVKKVSLRNLQFHTNETVTEINRRICVWFNPNISSIGAWDTTGCKVVVSTAEYTKCACDHFGRFTVMAEHTEPREVPPEELWLTITKYIGYILSFIALIAYIGVIAVSGDLKDQFHLIGLNLAVAVLFGSVFMLVSDMHSVRDDRHTCTAIGTLIHFFYLGAGAWIFALGHSSFKGITSGVISGRLKAYFFLAWSMPLMSMGLSYLLFMRDLGHDPRCFISWVNAPKYVFFGPQIFFCAVAFIFGLIVICNMATPALRKDNLIDDYGSFCNGASFVMIFFAFTWTFGLLAYVRFGFREPNFYPIFQVFNSCTGVVIFLFIGIGSKRFRMILAGQAALRRKMLFGNAFGTPPVLVDDKQTLGTPADQRSKSSSAPSSGRASPDFASRPPSHSSVAGRPGSRPRSGF